MKRAVFYGRYSSDRQTEQSIEGQRRVCAEFAKAEGIHIVAEYIDRATSGTSTDHRDQFQQMISDSKNGSWEYVLVYKLDRFARNRYDSAVYKQKLKRCGVKVLSATERITDSPEGILIEGLLESMDEYFSRELSRKCKRGIRETIIKGNTFTRAPYGYHKTEKRLVVDEVEASNVRQIFTQYVSGATLQSIADKLNSAGHRTRQGNPFRRYSVSDILHNPKYTGTYYVTDIAEPETCPQIVPQSLYDAAQERLKHSAHNARINRTGHVFALTGLLQCGICGRKVVGTSVQRKYFYYTCIAKSCKTLPHDHSLTVNSEKVEATVIAALAEYFTPEHVADFAERLYRMYLAEDSPKPDHSKQIQALEKQIQGAVNALIACPQSEALQARLTDLEQQKQQLEQAPPEPPKLTQQDFIKFFCWITKAIDRADDRKKFFNAVIHSVTLYRDHVVIAINLTNDDVDPPERIILEKSFSDTVVKSSLYPTISKIKLVPPLLLLYVPLPAGIFRHRGV